MSPVILALGLLPRVDAYAEASHDLGLDARIRGVVAAGLDATVLADAAWRLDIFTDVRSWIRPNVEGEGPVRISPRQVHYPVGARLRFDLDETWSWGLFARHQSNHDVDSTDPVMARETVSYEIYGAELVRPGLRLAAGFYYDRGTTRTLKRQRLPFDYYLAGASAEASHAFHEHGYGAAALEVVGHRNEDHAPPHVNLNGRAEVGAFAAGAKGVIKAFLRFERQEDYTFLGDDPVHVLLLGAAVDTRSP